MKTTILTCLISIALALIAVGQAPTPAPPMPPSPPPTPAVSATAVASASAGASISPAASVTPEEEDTIERSVKRKTSRHFSVTRSGPTITVDRHHRDHDDFDVEDGALMAIPIVGIIFTTLFGAPVMIVAAIMFFSYLRSRSLHRTVREMVAKGQPVPPALFAPPQAIRARSDMRRGVVLVMVGFALMIFFGAVSEWDGGVWAIGIIPFLIGVGHLIVWKMEGPKGADKAPPLP
ncbi:MAG TPA: DUF6249 domain-containing protein [Chthoniobacterales bacterium]|jgi:hypothetical protein|nr:DUF6249 domain-containing protein [Chthoniobacterales bacterium]